MTTPPPRSESRQLTELVGVRLTADELEAARILAARTGVKVPTFLRRLLLRSVLGATKEFIPGTYRTDTELVAAFVFQNNSTEVTP